ncbi:uncharacterized protein BO80DRAFT_366341, partial [Aspergillus ibericus CBS 121593]
INKNNFLKKYLKAYTIVFKKANIYSTVKALDLVPYKPSQILNKLFYKDFLS